MADETSVRKRKGVQPAATLAGGDDIVAARSWKEQLENHPLVVVVGAVIVFLGALYGAMSVARTFIETEVADQLKQRMTSEVLYKVAGGRLVEGSVQAVRDAIRDRRPISVKYAPIAGQPTEWTRRCDDFSVDTESSSGLTISCFILRVPDTTIEKEGRQFTDGATFEDHIVTSAGTREMRLYKIEDGRLTVSDYRSPAPVPSIEWTAPIIAENR